MSERVPGLYPWLRFDAHTREQWVEHYGLDLQYIDRRAANFYLEGEAAFFENFEKELPAYVSSKQRILENVRVDFAHTGANLCESPVEQILLAALIWTGYRILPTTGPIEIWDTTMPFAKPRASVVLSPQHQIGEHRVDFAIFINGVAQDEEIKVRY